MAPGAKDERDAVVLSMTYTPGPVTSKGTSGEGRCIGIGSLGEERRTVDLRRAIAVGGGESLTAQCS
jgi:hypothetical protein